jgi:hypothetical protein
MAGSITVLVRSKQPENRFGPYTAQMLRCDGISNFTIADMDGHSSGSNGTATAGAPGVIILTRCRLQAKEQERLLSYVRRGGSLIAFRPSYRLCETLGLTARFTATRKPYLRPDPDHPATRGLPGEPIQCHWATEHWGLGSLPGGAEVIAHDYSDIKTPTGYPAVIRFGYGEGEIALFFYDPPATVARVRFGDPELASTPTLGFRYDARPADLFLSHFDLSRGHLPQADLHCNLLSNVVSVMSPEPVPRLWYYPSPEVRSVMPMKSDDDWSTPEQFEALRDAVEARDGHCSFYLVRDTKMTDNEVKRWRANGHAFGFHSNPRSQADEDPYFTMEETLRQDAEEFRRRYGSTGRTTEIHSGFWKGYMDLVPLFEEIGLGMVVAYTSLRTAYGKYMCGSCRPMPFVDENGQISGVYQQSTVLYDDGHVEDMLTNGVDKELAKAARLLDDAVNLTYSPVGLQSHPVSFAEYSGRYISGCMDLAVARGIPIISTDEWLDFTLCRDSARLELASSNEAGLECDLIAGENPGDLTVAVPVPEGRSATSATVSGRRLQPETVSIMGLPHALVPTPAGSPHTSTHVRVEFGEG